MTQFAKQVAKGGKGMIEQHAWPSPSHDLTYALLHLRPIALDGALLAGGFVRSEAAVVQTAMGIEQEFLTLRTEARMPLPSSAIQTYHLLDHGFFFLYAFALFHDWGEVI